MDDGFRVTCKPACTREKFLDALRREHFPARIRQYSDSYYFGKFPLLNGCWRGLGIVSRYFFPFQVRVTFFNILQSDRVYSQSLRLDQESKTFFGAPRAISQSQFSPIRLLRVSGCRGALNDVPRLELLRRGLN